MKVNAYNPTNGNLVAEGVAGVYLGSVKPGKHGSLPVLIKPFKTVENNFLEMKLFLQNNGGLNASQFGYYANTEFMSGVDYTNFLSNHFELATGVTGISYTGVTGVPISLESGQPADYVWLDIQAGAYESGSTSTINYRFVFDYN